MCTALTSNDSTARYVSGGENRIEVNWTKFARDHDTDFNPEKTPILKKAVEYLQSKPPKKQIFRNGLEWKDLPRQKIPLLNQLLDSVKTARNNLFHGSKFPCGHVEDPGRDTDLIKSCIEILEECLLLDDEARDYFFP
jgi:hypothetical protein